MAADPVESVGVATALAGRYLDLARAAVTTSNLELAIGEGNQLYPEIWRHLDEARIELANRGQDVSGYDDLRRGELTAMGVNVDFTDPVQYTSRLGNVYYTSYTKTATFNPGGAQRALAAAEVLKRLMPEVDWAARAREQDQLIREAGSLKTAPWIALAKVGGALAIAGVVALLIFHFVWSASPEEQAPLTGRHHSHKAEPIVDPAAAPEPPPSSGPRATCSNVRSLIADRLAKANNLVRDASWKMRCEGVYIGNQPVALAISINARARGGALVDLRGLVSTNGMKDLQPLTPAPEGTSLAVVGDLDHDYTDELVFLGPDKLVVSRVSNAGFSDIAGPELLPACSADVSIEGDYSNGQKGEHRMLILSVPEDSGGKDCLAPGRHVYTLTTDRLVEN